MSRFIKEGELPANDLKAEEFRAQEEEEAYLKQKEKEERKSLQDQLYENRVRKAIEFQKLTEEQNSAYKITEKDLKYYEALKKKAELDELERQIQEEEGLQEFRRNKKLKELQAKDSDKSAATLPVPEEKKLLLKRRPNRLHNKHTKRPKGDRETAGEQRTEVKSASSDTDRSLDETTNPNLETEDNGTDSKTAKAPALVSGYSSSSDEE